MSGGRGRWGPGARLLWVLTVAVTFAPLLAWSAWHLGGLHPLGLLPLPLPWLALSPLGGWPTLLALLLLLPTMVAAWKPGHEVGRLAGLATGVILPAAYPWSTLDWSLLLKDWNLSHGGQPTLGTVLVASLPYLYVLLVHALSLPGQARRHYEAKGIPKNEVRQVTATLPNWALLAGAGGLATSLVSALVLGLPVPLPTAGALATPILVAVLVAGTIAWLLRSTVPPEGTEPPG